MVPKYFFLLKTRFLEKSHHKRRSPKFKPQKIKKYLETFSSIIKNYVTLDPDSMKIYRFHPTKSELLENDKFADYQFSQLFSYLSLEQYEEILKIAQR